MGDFYETFDSDAKLLSKELDIALTSREMGKGQRVPLAGIPFHSLETYLSVLIKKGYKVAICEQTSEPTKGKKIVDREVVRVVTPGTIVEDSLLDISSNNYLVSIFVKSDEVGLSFIDITTGEFATTQFQLRELSYELSRINPSEILLSEGSDIAKEFENKLTMIPNTLFNYENSKKTLLNHFSVSSLEAYGCSNLDLAIISAGAIISYIKDTQPQSLDIIKKLFTYSTNSFMSIDHYTKRNLELFENVNNSDSQNSLYSILNRTQTPIGSRLLKKFISFPLINVEEINKRQEVVNWLYKNGLNRKAIIELLNQISDIERLMSKIKRFSATPRDLLSLSNSLELSPQIKSLIKDSNNNSLFWIVESILDNYSAVSLINNSINLEATNLVGDGKTIKRGFSSELDQIYDMSKNARNFIANLQNEEVEFELTEEFITERVDHATEYFYKEGINPDGLDLIIEEVGIDEFTAFVIDGPQELNEDEAAYQKAKKKAIAGSDRREREGKGEYSPKGSSSPYTKQGIGAKTKKKPKIGHTGTKVVAATKKAKKAQPAKPTSREGLGSKIRSTVSKGFERHKAAVGKAKTQVKKIAKTASDTAKQHSQHRKDFVGGLKATPKERKIAGGIAKGAKKALTGEEADLRSQKVDKIIEAMSSYDKARKAAARRAADRNAKRRRGEMGGRMERETYTSEGGKRMHYKGYTARDGE